MSEYQESVFRNHAEYLAEIEQFVSLKGKKVLDFGCGSGAGTVYLSLRGIDIIGIDNNQPGYDYIAAAREYALVKGSFATFEYSDGKTLRFPGQSFDVVLAIDVLEHLDDPETQIYEICRVLKPDGKLIIIWQPYYAPYGGHLRLFSRNPWRQLMPFFNKERFLKVACEKNPACPYEHGIKVINSLNKLTLRQFKRMAKAPSFGFKLNALKKRLFKTKNLDTASRLERYVRIFLNRLPLLPILEEFTTQSVLIILEKKQSNINIPKDTNEFR